MAVDHGLLEFERLALGTGSLAVRLNGPTDGGRIDFKSPVNLAGSFVVDLTPGYVPLPGTWFTNLTYAAHSGQFAQTNLPSADWLAVCGPTEFKVRGPSTVLPGPTVARWTNEVVGGWGDADMWDPKRVPNDAGGELFDVFVGPSQSAYLVHLSLTNSVTVNNLWVGGNARLELVDDARLSLEPDGVATFAESGGLGGVGYVSRAVLERGAILSGWSVGDRSFAKIGFDELTLKPGAVVQIEVASLGVSDHLAVAKSVAFGGNLVVGMHPGVALTNSDVIELVALAPDCVVTGGFENVALNHDMTDQSGMWLFRLALEEGPPRAVVLRDFQPITDSSWWNCIIEVMRRMFHGGVPSPRMHALKDLGSDISLASYRALEALMNQTPEGRRLVGTYWRYSPEVVQIVLTNSPLAKAASKLLTDFQPAVVALLSGGAAAAQITQPLIDELNSTWNSLTNYASPALRLALETERTRFHGFQDFVGKDFSQWAALLQIPGPTNAFIHISNMGFTNGQFSTEANLVTGRTVSLWRASDLALKDWAPASGALVETNGYTLHFTDIAPSSQRHFYQLRAQP